MKELSMHILDIVMNSIKARASLIELHVEDCIKDNYIKFIIKDNGIGMSREMTKLVTDPFFTTRTTRKVGLGISILKESCERCNGFLHIESKLMEGTLVECSFERDNIDRAPLGNMGDTILTIINMLDNCEIIYTHMTDIGSFRLSTVYIKEILEGVSIKNNEILLWIREFVNENIQCISKI